MKIYIVGKEKIKDHQGGGFSFISHFIDGLTFGDIVNDSNECDIYFVPSASMVEKNNIIPEGKKIVLRIDNVLKNSRNKNAGMRKMREIAERADLIVYQSEWAKGYISPMIKTNAKEVIIINGSDDKIFNPEGAKILEDKTIYLYIRSSNHDNKSWHIAHYHYEIINQQIENTKLYIIGKFSRENLEYNFDFCNNEDYEFMGFVADRSYLATLYRTANYLLFPYYNDACSQTLIEWILTKNSVEEILLNNGSGGNMDIIWRFEKEGREGLSIKRMMKDYEKELNGI